MLKSHALHNVHRSRRGSLYRVQVTKKSALNAVTGENKYVEARHPPYPYSYFYIIGPGVSSVQVITYSVYTEILGFINADASPAIHTGTGYWFLDLWTNILPYITNKHLPYR